MALGDGFLSAGYVTRPRGIVEPGDAGYIRNDSVSATPQLMEAGMSNYMTGLMKLVMQGGKAGKNALAEIRRSSPDIAKKLSKYVKNVSGSTARRTGKAIKDNQSKLTENSKEIGRQFSKQNKAKAGKNSLVNSIKEKAATVRLDKARKLESQLIHQKPNLKIANDLAVAGRNLAQIKTGAGLGVAGMVAAPLLSDDLSKAGTRSTVVDTESGPVVLDQNGTAQPSFTVDNLKGDFPVNTDSLETSYYGDKINLGDPEGDFIPGFNAVFRKNEVGSTYRPVPEYTGEVVDNRDMRIANNAVKITPREITAAIADVDRDEPITNVKKTISSDPGYTDGYRVDAQDIGSRKVTPVRAATTDPLNLFGQKNGFNPFSNKERVANGQKKLSFTDFFKSGVGTR